VRMMRVAVRVAVRAAVRAATRLRSHALMLRCSFE
jgi:hypothetical protein